MDGWLLFMEMVLRYQNQTESERAELELNSVMAYAVKHIDTQN